MRSTRHIIVLQQQGNNKAWNTVCLLHAAVNRTSGSERLDGGAVQSPMQMDFDVRYSPEVAQIRLATQRYRLLYAGAAYKIVAYDDYMEAHRSVRLSGVSYVARDLIEEANGGGSDHD